MSPALIIQRPPSQHCILKCLLCILLMLSTAACSNSGGTTPVMAPTPNQQVASTNTLAPNITSTPPANAHRGEEWRYQLQADNPNGGNPTYSIDGGPKGMVVSTKGLITWTPPVGITKASKITVTIRDATGATASQTFSIMVDNANPQILVPNLDGVITATARRGCPATFAFTVVDVAGPDSNMIMNWSPSTSGPLNQTVAPIEMATGEWQCSLVMPIDATRIRLRVTGSDLGAALDSGELIWPVVETPVFTINGIIDGDGSDEVVITVSLDGQVVQRTSPGNDGQFTFAGLAAGTYVVAASSLKYNLLPRSRTIKIESEDVPVQRFSSFRIPTANLPPTAANYQLSTLTDTPIEFNLLSQCLDPNGDQLALTSVATPSHGHVVTAGARITYTPHPGYTGGDSFSYTIADDHDATASGTVTVTIAALDGETSATIGPQGGVVAGPGAGITIPAGALADPTVVKVRIGIDESGNQVTIYEVNGLVVGDVTLDLANGTRTTVTSKPHLAQPLAIKNEINTPIEKYPGNYLQIEKHGIISARGRTPYTTSLTLHLADSGIRILSNSRTTYSQLLSHSVLKEHRGSVPVLLIHGYTGGEDLGGGRGTWGELPRILNDYSNIDVYEFQWRTNSRFQDTANDLRQAIDTIVKLTGSRVHIVAHSFGGLVARTYLQGLARDVDNAQFPSGYATPVASLVTLGTPHSGIAGDKNLQQSQFVRDLPEGQDSWFFQFANQISVHQAGSKRSIHWDEDMYASAFGVFKNEGEIPYELGRMTGSTFVNPFPWRLRILNLIGLTTDRNPLRHIDLGDKLISYDGQRFHPSFQNRKPIAAENYLFSDTELTEQVLGSGPGSNIGPGDANPWTSTNEWGGHVNGYAHTSILNQLNQWEAWILYSDRKTHASSIAINRWLSGPPAISSIADQTCLPGAKVGPIPFTLTGNIVTNAEYLATSAISSNTALLPTENIVLGGNGPDRTVLLEPAAGQSGSSIVTILASDFNGAAARISFILSVSHPPPVITSTLTAVGAIGRPFQYQITADNSPLGYSATPLPAGMTIDVGTGVISGTPSSPGRFTITITAWNEGGATTEKAIITIQSVPTAIPQTGQVFSYAPGDDGDKQPGVTLPTPRFVDNKDGTVSDILTGLVWLKDTNAFGSATWDRAITICSQLAHGQAGLTDGSIAGQWRLPNREEMSSLCDYGKNLPAISHPHPFLSLPNGLHWTSTTEPVSSVDAAQGVDLCYGYMFLESKTDSFRVWPVRDPSAIQARTYPAIAPVPITGAISITNYSMNPREDGSLRHGVAWPAPRFTDNANGTITDNLTKLIWLKNANAFGCITWPNALQACAGLAHGQAGLTDGSIAGQWRLPTVRELKSLASSGYSYPCIPNTVGSGQCTEGKPFTDIVKTWPSYWSSTTVNLKYLEAYIVYLGYACVGSFEKSTQSYVWPVRGP